MAVTFKERCDHLAKLLEEEVEKAYIESPVPGKELDQRFYEGWMACCSAFRTAASLMSSNILVSEARFAALVETLQESPTARLRLAAKIAKLQQEGK